MPAEPENQTLESDSKKVLWIFLSIACGFILLGLGVWVGRESVVQVEEPVVIVKNEDDQTLYIYGKLTTIETDPAEAAGIPPTPGIPPRLSPYAANEVARYKEAARHFFNNQLKKEQEVIELKKARTDLYWDIWAMTSAYQRDALSDTTSLLMSSYGQEARIHLIRYGGVVTGDQMKWGQKSHGLED